MMGRGASDITYNDCLGRQWRDIRKEN